MEREEKPEESVKVMEEEDDEDDDDMADSTMVVSTEAMKQKIAEMQMASEEGGPPEESQGAEPQTVQNESEPPADPVIRRVVRPSRSTATVSSLQEMMSGAQASVSDQETSRVQREESEESVWSEEDD